MIVTFCLMLFFQGASPKPFEPIQQWEWELKVEPENNIEDAVCIEDWTILFPSRMERYVKYRILSESGKAAASFQDEGKGVKDLKGRVVLRNGTEIPFKQKSDMVETLAFKSRYEKKKSKFLVPPGLDEDCIVEMSWYVPTVDGLPESDNTMRLLIAQDFFCKKRVFVIPPILGDTYPWLITRVVWTQSEGVKYKKYDKSGKTVIQYQDIPALAEYPFGNDYLDQSIPYFLIFRTGNMASSEPDGYWKNYARGFLGENLRATAARSSEYKQWVKELKSQLPKEPDAALLMAHKAFRKYFAALDFCTAEQKSGYVPPTNQSTIPTLAGHYIQNRIGPSAYLTFIYQLFLDDLDIKAKMIFGTSIYGPPFRPSELNIQSLSLYHPIFGVEVNGKWSYVSPIDLEYEEGMIPYYMRGGAVAIVDFTKGWKISFGELPRAQAPENQQTVLTIMQLGADGKLNIKVQEGGTGEFNVHKRRTYYPLNEEERKESLKRRARNLIRNFEVTDVAVYGADEVDAQVKTVYLGNMDIELDEYSALSLDPFPGSVFPIELPNWWPKDRTQPFILPYSQVITEESQIRVPAGFKLLGQPSWIKKNSIGGVQIQAEQKENLITVRRSILIGRDILNANEESELKALLAWIEEAHWQNIRISKGDKS